MNCKFSYVKEPDNFGRHVLYCSVLKEKCPLVRFCNRVNDYINIDGYNVCNYISLGENNNAKCNNLNNKVRFERNGKLYVEVNDQVMIFENPFNEIPKYVNVICNEGQYTIDKSRYQT
jgi:hypothetical protein